MMAHPPPPNHPGPSSQAGPGNQPNEEGPLPAARKDLQISPQLYLGQTVYVVKDPVSLNYFRLRPTEYYIFTQLDGRITATDLAQRVASVFPEEPTSPQRISQFVATLKSAGLLYGQDVSHSQILRQIADQRKQQRRKAKLISFMFIRLPLLDPDPLLNWLYRYLGVLMNGLMCIAAIILIALSTAAVLLHLGHMDQAPAWAILSPVNVALMLLTFLGIKVVHEFGHGLAAKHRNVEVHELGVFFMVFLPIFYIQVDDAWMVPRRRDRLWIVGGGVFLEMVFASLAGWVWILTEPGIINQIAMNVMITASVTTLLFNLNPLLRYDGYYFLMYWMEIPNMRQKAQQYLAYVGKKYLLGLPGQRPGREAADRPIFMSLFAIAASIYRWLIVLMIVGLVWAVLAPVGLEPVAVLLAATAVSTMVLRPLIKTLSFVWQVQAQNSRRVAVSVGALGLAGGVIGLLMTLPIEHSVQSPGVILSEQRRSLYAPASARVTEVFVRSGQYVEAGEPILQMDADDVRDMLEELRIEQREMALHYNLALREGEVDRAASIAMQRREHARQIAHLEQRLEELTIRAPISGYVHPHHRLEKLTGAALSRGDELGQVIAGESPTFVLIVPQREIGQLAPGMPVRVRLWAEPDRAMPGTVTRIGGRLVDQLPHPALAAGVGGEVDVLPDRRYTWSPAEPSVMVHVAFVSELNDPGEPGEQHGQATAPPGPEPAWATASAETAATQAAARVGRLDHALYDGMTGRGRIQVRDRTRLGSQLWRWTRQRLSLDWWL